MNREIGRFFRTFISEQHTKWAEYITIIATCINNVHHETTQETPVQLHFNCTPSREWKKFLSPIPSQKAEKTHEERIALAREHIYKKGIRRSEKINKKRYKYNVNDEALLRTPAVSSAEEKKIAKMFDLYTGYFIITKIVDEYTYILIDPNTGEERGMFHADVLKPYYQEGNLNIPIATIQKQ